MYKKNRSLQMKFLIRLLIPIILFSLWIILTISYIFSLDTAFSVISYVEPNNTFKNITYNRLLKNDSLDGSFVASENNLGIVQIKFQTFFRPAYADEDKILFELRQSRSATWYYKGVYRGGLIYGSPYFPFGFPVITNSKGKSYEFRIVSLRGTESNSVALAQGGTIISTKYKYTRSELLQSKSFFVSFILRKIYNAFDSTEVIFSSIVYALPLIVYLSIFMLRKQIYHLFDYLYKRSISKRNRSRINKRYARLFVEGKLIDKLMSSVILVCMLFDVFYFQLKNDFIYLIIPILFMTIQLDYRKNKNNTFIVGIYLLCISPLLLLINSDIASELITSYAFLFLSAGMLQFLIFADRDN